MGVGGQRHAPAALPPVKTRYPLYRILRGPQGRSGRVRKISPPTGIRSPDRPARSESLRVRHSKFSRNSQMISSASYSCIPLPTIFPASLRTPYLVYSLPFPEERAGTGKTIKFFFRACSKRSISDYSYLSILFLSFNPSSKI